MASTDMKDVGSLSGRLAQVAAIYADLLQQKKLPNAPGLRVALLLNSKAPVNRLPLEILVRIFHFVQPVRISMEETEEELLLEWYGLLGVCSLWRTIACGAPLLWRTIFVGTKIHIGLFRLLLERTAATPLELTFTATHDIQPLLAELRRTLPRIQTLEFVRLPRSQSAAVSDFLNNSGDMPLLNELRVSFGKYGYESEFPPFEDQEDGYTYIDEGTALFRFTPRAGQFPRLNSLTLRSVSLANLSALAPSLTSLILSHAICEHVPLTELLELLEKSTILKTLYLDRYRFHDPALAFWTRYGSHPLPRVAVTLTLRRFGITDVGPYTARLLSALSFPITSDVRVTRLPHYNDGGDEFDDDSLAPAQRTVSSCLPKVKTGLPLLSEISNLDVELTDYHGRTFFDEYGSAQQFRGYAEKAHFEVASRFHGSRNPTDDLIAVFGRASLLELKISGLTTDQLDVDDWARIMRAFPLLRRLAIVTLSPWTGHTMQGFFLALAAHQPDGTVLCPHLTDLAITATKMDEDASVLRIISECLEARIAFGRRLTRLRVAILEPIRRITQGSVSGASAERQARYVDSLRLLVDAVEFGPEFQWLTGSGRDFWDAPAERVRHLFLARYLQLLTRIT